MRRIKLKNIIYFLIPLILIMSSMSIKSININNDDPPSVDINLDPFSVIYEGDIISCDFTGDPEIKYWYINDNQPHCIFKDDNPVILDPDPTPLDESYVNLTVYVENSAGNDSDSVKVMIKRLFFGDIHFHSKLSDGKYSIDMLYKNAIKDNYLDFVCLSNHAEVLNSIDTTSPYFIRDLIQVIINNLQNRSEWQILKEKAIEYYQPGNFTTLLGFEYSAGPKHPGGKEETPLGHEDVSHINIYY